MIDLIIKALDKAMVTLNKKIPLTKKDTVIIDLDELNISPIDLGAYMVDNDIPADACFVTLGVDGAFGSDTTAICYDVDIPVNDNDIIKFKRRMFTSIAFMSVYNTLMANGYKRVGFNSGLLKEFNNTTVYDMYIDNDFDRLVKYYSLPFSSLLSFKGVK